MARGDLGLAVDRWSEAARRYQASGDASAETHARAALAQAYEEIGESGRARETLDRVLAIAEASAIPTRVATALTGIANAALSTGDTVTAETHLQRAETLLASNSDACVRASVAAARGSLFAARELYSDALTAYRDGLALAQSCPDHAFRADLFTSAAMAATAGAQPGAAAHWAAAATGELQQLPDGHDKAYRLVAIAQTVDRLERQAAPNRRDFRGPRAYELLTQAASIAEHLGDARAGSYAWGVLGENYERAGRFEEALQLTRRALFDAQRANMPAALYRWHWQAGRLLNALGRTDQALGSYRIAVATLQTIRLQERRGADRRRWAFDESVKPVFLELVDLLLQRTTRITDAVQQQPYLREAREVMETFKVAELQDYFHDDCVDTSRGTGTSLEGSSGNAAVIYPILFADRIELLVSLPGGLRRHAVPVRLDQLTGEARRFRMLLESRNPRYLANAQLLYDWLVRPVEGDLDSAAVDTLVFVPSGPLLTIPMSALHDGKQFLIEKYPLAVTPALRLTDPHSFARQQARVLLLGLTEPVQGYPALPSVATEIDAIHGLYHGTVLLNADFRVQRLQQEAERVPFNVVHFASHGEFDADVEKTFLLTYDGKLTMDGLDQWVGLFKAHETPLELLTLSACETAAGDDRAALGLAGVAVKAGAKSAVASLWAIDDRAAATLAIEFYRQLRDSSLTKAVALQRAQLQLLHAPGYQHPGYWAPFLLISNWQ